MTLASFGDNFHLRLARWLTAELEVSNVELPGAIAFSPGDHVSPTSVTFQSAPPNSDCLIDY